MKRNLYENCGFVVLPSSNEIRMLCEEIKTLKLRVNHLEQQEAQNADEYHQAFSGLWACMMRSISAVGWTTEITRRLEALMHRLQGNVDQMQEEVNCIGDYSSRMRNLGLNIQNSVSTCIQLVKTMDRVDVELSEMKATLSQLQETAAQEPSELHDLTTRLDITLYLFLGFSFIVLVAAMIAF
jgi:uncharacterized protein YukE